MASAVAAAGSGGDWEVEAAPPWVGVRRRSARRRDQGWKLHVSGTVWSAREVLSRALPVLLGHGAAWKAAASLEALAGLNEGASGLSQVGKLLTVYPADDASAPALAKSLDVATAGLAGPAVPGEAVLRTGSLVSYRYGSFSARLARGPSGRWEPVMAAPDGRLVPDRRGAPPPAWATDPFRPAVAVPAWLGADVTPAELVGGRYLPVGVLYRSPRGSVHLGIDVAGARACVLKRAARHARAGRDGTDARDHLRHEVAVLARLAPGGRVPAVYDLIGGTGGDLVAVFEHVEGETLAACVDGLAVAGRLPRSGQVAAWGAELAEILAGIHAAGLAYGDVKADNVLVTPGGTLRLVDFEHAHPVADGRSPARAGTGTAGYRPAVPGSPVADDLYGLGAVLYFLATGAPPPLAPRPHDLLSRPVAVLNPAADQALITVIARCLAPEAADRFPDAPAVAAALRPLVGGAPGTAPFAAPTVIDRRPGRPGDFAEAGRWADLARRLGAAISEGARPAGQGLTWEGPAGPAIVDRDLGAGSSGVVVALAELVDALGDTGPRDALAGGAGELASSAFPTGGDAGPVLGGLYVGEGGPAAALLRAGQVLGDATLLEAAARRARLVATLPHGPCDLTHGAAGRARLHLLVYDETGEAEDLQAAVAAGRWLLARAIGSEEGGACWPGPAWEIPSGAAQPGYAHGAAGIGDVLLDLFEATGDERFAAAASAAGRWLARTALPALDDARGLTWPRREGGPPAGARWCHGATGVARFLLHAARLDVFAGARRLAEAASWCAARGARHASPGQCHGLAGNIELLLDVAAATPGPGDSTWAAEAAELAGLLACFSVEADGGLRWPSDDPPGRSWSYLTGCAGILACLVRLADPTRPATLSRAGFRHHQAIPPGPPGHGRPGSVPPAGTPPRSTGGALVPGSADGIFALRRSGPASRGAHGA